MVVRLGIWKSKNDLRIEFCNPVSFPHTWNSAAFPSLLYVCVRVCLGCVFISILFLILTGEKKTLPLTIFFSPLHLFFLTPQWSAELSKRKTAVHWAFSGPGRNLKLLFLWSLASIDSKTFERMFGQNVFSSQGLKKCHNYDMLSISVYQQWKNNHYLKNIGWTHTHANRPESSLKSWSLPDKDDLNFHLNVFVKSVEITA